MAPQPIRIDNVGMTVIMCRRMSNPRTTTRKFKAACGSVTEFTIEASGKIASTKQHHEFCRSGCTACDERTRLAKLLIESGK